MRTRKGILIGMLTLVLVFAFTLPAMAARGCGGGGVDAALEVDKDAPGTKLKGTLTVTYLNPVSVEVPPLSGNFIDYYDMYFFLRIGKGHDLKAFAGVTTPTLVDYGDVYDLKAKIETFFNDIVIPKLYPEGVIGFALKSVDNYVEDTLKDPEATSDLLVDILDVVITVVD